MTRNDPLATLQNIDWLISNGGEVSLGAFGPASCAAVATDESGCLAMLRRGEDESLHQLLVRLDAAIDRAWEAEEFIDEINPTR